MVAELRERGIGFQSLPEALDTTTPGGRPIFHVFAALAEFIRELIVAGTHEGLAAARGRRLRLYALQPHPGAERGPELPRPAPVGGSRPTCPHRSLRWGPEARALTLTSYSVRRAVAVRALAAQPAGRSAPRVAMSRPPSASGSSWAPW